MTTSSSAPGAGSPRSVYTWLPADIWRRLIEPAASLQQPAQRRRARLLASLLLVLVPLGLAVLVVAAWSIGPLAGQSYPAALFALVLTAIAVLAGAYALCRAGHYTPAAALTVSVISVTVFVVALLLPSVPTTVVFMSLGMLTSGLFLSRRATVLVFVATLVATVALPLLDPQLPPRTVVSVLSFVLIAGALMWVALAVQQEDLQRIEQQSRALAESETRFRAIVQSANEAIISADSHGRIVTWSQGAQAILGYCEAEMVGQPLSVLMPARYVDPYQRAWERWRTAGETTRLGNTVEYQARRKDGVEIPVEYWLAVWQAGGETYHAAFMRDITERKQAEEALRENEEKFQGITASAKDAIILLDNEGNIGYWNNAAEGIFGYSAQEAIGREAHGLLAPERYHAAYRKGYPRFREIGEGPVLGKTLELVAVRKDGTEFPVELSASAVKLKGRWNAIGVLRDVTERKRIDGEVRRLSHQNELILGALGEGVYGVDLEGKATFLNPAAAEMLGYQPEELIGQPMHEAMHHSKPDGTRLPREACLIYGAFRNGMVNRADDEVFWRKDGTSLPVEYVSTPIREGETLAGAVVVFKDISERMRAEAEAKQANTQLVHSVGELEQRTQELALLGEMSQLFHACESAQEAYTVIARYTQKLFPAESGGVFVFRSSRNLVEAVAAWGPIDAGDREFAPNQCWALRLGKPYLVSEPAPQLVCDHLGAAKPASYLCAPVMGHGEILGLLHLGAPAEPPSVLSKSRQQLALALAEQIGLALANVTLRETLRDQAIRDPLTNLYNRRYLAEMLEREFYRAERKRAPLGIVMIDIDHFKHFNDTFGHDAGDVLLRELARFVQAAVRREDIACRYGGEEFILVLPEAPPDMLRQRAEALRAGSKELSVRHRGQTLGAITLSLGLAAYPEHGATAESLLRAADRAMYQAKQQGRDRVVVAESVRA